MYSRPSASQMRLFSPRSMKRGVPPTARNARTGELTPPGIVFRERSNSRSFFEDMSAEQPREIPRAPFDVRRIEQGADHGNRIDPRFDHGLRVLARNPSDRNDGASQARLRFAVQGQGRSRRAGLGAGGKGATEGDIVRAGAACSYRKVELVVARRPQELVRAQPRPRRGDRHVLAAEVQAVGAERFRQIEVVVDDEGKRSAPTACTSAAR